MASCRSSRSARPGWTSSAPPRSRCSQSCRSWWRRWRADRQGAVAESLRTPLLAAGWAFTIWAPIYAGFLVYAGYQLLPAQRGREIHRRTGWWAAASALFNPLWIITFGSRLILLAELLLVALLVVLAVVFGRLSREPAADRVERAAFRGPLALYTGWVSLATVLGTAATGVWAGLPGDNALAAIAAVVVLLAAAGIVAWVVLSGTAVVPYAAAVVWALIGIALNTPPAAVVGRVRDRHRDRARHHAAPGHHRGQPRARRLGLRKA